MAIIGPMCPIMNHFDYDAQYATCEIRGNFSFMDTVFYFYAIPYFAMYGPNA